jgi:sulfite exporter TauE/SafE/copper chaperone CopZ
MIKEHIYYVKGMHCASCEILIEKKLLELPNIKSVNASTAKGEVVVEYEDVKPKIENLNKIFEKDNYKFFENQIKGEDFNKNHKKSSPTLIAFNIAAFIIIAFLILDKIGIGGFINVNSTSSLGAFFMFGILASLSSCAALVGGIILSMSKQWGELYGNNSTIFKKIQPHITFNLGRIIAYGIFGAILGIIGNRLQISLQFTAFMIITISFLMIVLRLQMLGVKYFRKFQLSLPKSATRFIANENNFKGKFMPFLMGAATIILPCGFTITAEGLALLSSNPLQGFLIMLAFVLGTTPILFSIGFSSIKFLSKPNFAEKFSKVAGFLVLFFALFNINTQMNILGFVMPNFNTSSSAINQNELPQIIKGVQILKMNASARGYSPNYLKVKTGIPIRWEITDTGTSGCTNAIISKSLFSGEIRLTPGETSIKEFTISKPGKYKFSCWMGMVTGTIEAIN